MIIFPCWSFPLENAIPTGVSLFMTRSVGEICIRSPTGESAMSSRLPCSRDNVELIFSISGRLTYRDGSDRRVSPSVAFAMTELPERRLKAHSGQSFSSTVTQTNVPVFIEATMTAKDCQMCLNCSHRLARLVPLQLSREMRATDWIHQPKLI